MTTQEAYLKMQDECGLKEGDTVKVLRTARSAELGWGLWWNDHCMDDSVGGDFKVKALAGGDGILLTNGCYYPWFVLELVGGADRPVEMTVAEISEELGYEVKIVKG